ncbi:LPXTG cell wall anchor domain-containing protein [Companilactobacillus mindensis]|uniref:LPXTG cell wall anchor domain-containing protein n=1 Tax=Companilactobacillus mindensis TaxID=167481 RepID=UPI0009F96B2A
MVDPENPGSNNNNNNTTGGVITNPTNTNNTSNSNNGNNSTNTLPQTGEKSGLVASLLGLVLLSSVLYIKRRNA